MTQPDLQLPLLTVYRLRRSPPEAELQLAKSETMQISIVGGSFSILRGVNIPDYSSDSAGVVMGTEQLFFPKGAYLFLVSKFNFLDISGFSRSQATLKNTEFASALDLKFPHLIAERVFEGVPSKPNEISVDLESPVSLTVGPPISDEIVLENTTTILQQLNTMSAIQRSRFQLASRWFRRGSDATSEIDRLLFWYIVLEIYPAQDSQDVPNLVVKFLHQQIYPDIDIKSLKEKIGIGHLASLRAKIVHDGQLNIPPNEYSQYEGRLRQLQALARVSLKHLLGEPVLNDLDEWVK
ncbi:MAG: hypothetical protein AB1554_07790 [Chloroflexota bacterium]